MPADLLLPLFTLTLLANAVLVAFAIRSMRSSSSGHGRSDGTGRATAWQPPTSTSVSPRGAPSLGGTTPGPVAPAGDAEAPAAGIREAGDGVPGTPATPSTGPAEVPAAAPATATDPGPTRTGRAVPARRSPAASRRTPRAKPSDARPGEVTADEAAGQVAGDAVEAAGGRSDPSTAPEPTAPAPTAPAPTAPEPTAPAPVAARRRSRRRFSLPPLDEDHEKVNRSIKSFLAGADSADAAAVGGPPPPSDGATTIALIALDGPADRERVARPGRPDMPAAGRDPAGDVTTAVERTLRAAARGSDVVTVVGRGRFRITLRETGELAARAYLRRVRATVEPLLESSERPLRLTIATATALDEPLEAAVERAERRLAAALAGPHADDPAALDGSAADGERPERTPRAAAD